MGTTKGIFVPFKEYVQKQLKVRQSIIANARSINFLMPGTNVPIDIPPEYSDSFNLDQRGGVYSSDAFYGYTVEKQAIIRMMSGVDIRVGSKGLSDILKEEMSDPDLHYLTAKGENLAKQYILEAGVQFYNERGNLGGLRESFVPDNLEDPVRAFAYGDKNIRSNANSDGYGIVPMPGIIDAEIRTKSDNGSLREAKINFICHNKRQLEILEMLYMRPGMPLVLEWGWNPYIDNNGDKQNNNFTTREEWFKSTSNLDSIMALIRKYKELSGGNFDGIMGYCKNFSFKANEIGGFECTTEIMSYGEIIETLAPQKVYKESKDVSEEGEGTTAEIEDSLLHYLRAIKNTLRTPTSIQNYQDATIADIMNKDNYSYEAPKNNFESMRTPLGYEGEGGPSYYGHNKSIKPYTNPKSYTS